MNIDLTMKPTYVTHIVVNKGISSKVSPTTMVAWFENKILQHKKVEPWLRTPVHIARDRKPTKTEIQALSTL